MSLKAGVMTTLVTALISSFVISASGAPYPLRDRVRRQDDFQTPSSIFWPSDIIAVSQAQPDHAISNVGKADTPYIFSLPGANQDVAIEVAFPIPGDLHVEASCMLGFYALSEEAELPNWIKNLEGEHRFAIYGFSAATTLISSEDTWHDRPIPDFAAGVIAVGIVNNRGIHLETSTFECHKVGPQAQFWLQCEEDQYCDFAWTETKSPLSGLVLQIFEGYQT